MAVSIRSPQPSLKQQFLAAGQNPFSKSPDMKNFLVFAILLALPCFLTAQNKAINKFYRQHKREAGVKNAKLPGWVVRIGGRIARSKVETQAEKEAMSLFRKFGKVKFMYSEEGKSIPQKDIAKLREGLLNMNYDDLIFIKDAGMNMQIMVEDNDEMIKSVLMFFNDGESGEMIFVSARTNVNYKELSKLIRESMKDKAEKLEPLIEETEEEAPPADVVL